MFSSSALVDAINHSQRTGATKACNNPFMGLPREINIMILSEVTKTAELPAIFADEANLEGLQVSVHTGSEYTGGVDQLSTLLDPTLGLTEESMVAIGDTQPIYLVANGFDADTLGFIARATEDMAQLHRCAKVNVHLDHCNMHLTLPNLIKWVFLHWNQWDGCKFLGGMSQSSTFCDYGHAHRSQEHALLRHLASLAIDARSRTIPVSEMLANVAQAIRASALPEDAKEYQELMADIQRPTLQDDMQGLWAGIQLRNEGDKWAGWPISADFLGWGRRCLSYWERDHTDADRELAEKRHSMRQDVLEELLELIAQDDPTDPEELALYQSRKAELQCLHDSTRGDDVEDEAWEALRAYLDGKYGPARTAAEAGW